MTHPFITHNGGPCPVSPETVVDVKFRDGGDLEAYVASHMEPDWTSDNWWQWEGLPDNNIIAYRLHQPDNHPTEV